MELGTAIALVAFSDQCIKYGTKLVKRCENYKHAQQEAKEFLITIELNWLKTEAQIAFLRSIADTLDEKYLAIQCHILSELEGKLKTATLTLDQLIKSKERGIVLMSAGKKLLYAFKKDSLQVIVEDLEKWQARFDPCWMLIMRLDSRYIDDQLFKETRKPAAAQSQFILTAGEIREAARANLADSPAVEATRLDNNLSNVEVLPYSQVLRAWDSRSSSVLVDRMRCVPFADIEETTKDARKLALILQKVDSKTFGLLKCEGIIEEHENIVDRFGDTRMSPIFNFVFRIPHDIQNPRSLRSILQEAAPYPLNERLDLAKKLAHSVLYVHTARFVHKSIRPETIIIFEDSMSVIGSPFLLGFEKFRPADGQTYMVGDGDWEKNLYRHPKRQGVLPEDQYQMQHDAYSLGVVLLEIGLWSSFVSYLNTHGQNTAVPSNSLSVLQVEEEKHPRRRAYKNKQVLEGLAEQNLPRIIGRKYTDVVLLCLRCLDEGDSAGFELVPARQKLISTSDGVGDDIDIGLQFVHNVLDRIQGISI
ncbi:hypothetical protein B0O99DRAFT_617450 [Bisporella sp. PMI_857]|nr:hypothetical protein B0O99DRAFT_617450 [Bisporella sp. PMI_857]